MEAQNYGRIESLPLSAPNPHFVVLQSQDDGYEECLERL